jgi:hypothetical protein
MKIEVRQAEVQQQRLPGELALAARKFHRDLLVLAAIDLRRLDRLDDRLSWQRVPRARETMHPASEWRRARQAGLHGNAAPTLAAAMRLHSVPASGRIARVVRKRQVRIDGGLTMENARRASRLRDSD